MAKKRRFTLRSSQTEFWTALPIDECRARIVELQIRSSNTFTMLRQEQQTPSMREATFSSFKLTHYHQLGHWQRYSPFSNKYRLTVTGTLQSTTDGTHVSLKLATGTKSRLGVEKGIGWWNILAGGLMGIVVGGLILLQILAGLINGTAASQIQNNGGVTNLCGSAFFLVVWFSMMGTITWGRWSRHKDLAAAAEALITSVRDELYETPYQPPPLAAKDRPYRIEGGDISCRKNAA